MTERKFSSAQKNAAKKLLIEWYKERGETVRKARLMKSDALRKCGHVYHVECERWKVGDVAVKMFCVKKDDKLFLTCADVRLGSSPRHDEIISVIEFERNVKHSKANWGGGLDGNHFSVRTMWNTGSSRG